MAISICESCEKVITGQVMWTDDDVPLCRTCNEALQAEEAERQAE